MSEKYVTLESYWNWRAGLSWLGFMVFGGLALASFVPLFALISAVAVAYHFYALYNLENNRNNTKKVPESTFNLWGPRMSDAKNLAFEEYKKSELDRLKKMGKALDNYRHEAAKKKDKDEFEAFLKTFPMRGGK